MGRHPGWQADSYRRRSHRKRRRRRRGGKSFRRQRGAVKKRRRTGEEMRPERYRAIIRRHDQHHPVVLWQASAIGGRWIHKRQHGKRARPTSMKQLLLQHAKGKAFSIRPPIPSGSSSSFFDFFFYFSSSLSFFHRTPPVFSPSSWEWRRRRRKRQRRPIGKRGSKGRRGRRRARPQRGAMWHAPPSLRRGRRSVKRRSSRKRGGAGGKRGRGRSRRREHRGSISGEERGATATGRVDGPPRRHRTRRQGGDHLKGGECVVFARRHEEIGAKQGGQLGGKPSKSIKGSHRIVLSRMNGMEDRELWDLNQKHPSASCGDGGQWGKRRGREGGEGGRRRPMDGASG